MKSLVGVLLVILGPSLLAGQSVAQSSVFLETGQLSDKALEQRAIVLGKTLRCVVCANQSIEDSDVELAQSLRKRVRQRLWEGLTEDQIREELISSYGEYISYFPRFKGLGLVLWLSPWLILILSVGLFFVQRAGRKKG